MKALRRRWWVGLVVLAIVLVAPLSVSAATNTEIIAILNAVINGVVAAGRDAYCAAGVPALCP